MGLFDSSLFGGMFDLNGDGNIDLGEEFMAYKMYEEVTRDDDEDDDLFKDDENLSGDDDDGLFSDDIF